MTASATAVRELRKLSREPNPYLHVGADRVYNPQTDRTLSQGEEGYDLLLGLLAGDLTAADLEAAAAAELARGGWTVAAGEDPSRSFYLKYVSLEAHTVCNQACYFCPVSVAPRESYFMPTELYERIVGELGSFRDTIEAVSLINYNEPTLDRRFVEQVRCLRQAGLPPAVLTNGTGLTPERVDALLAMGGISFLSINLSTLDRDKYHLDRVGDHLGVVLQNLDYMRDLPLAETMEIVVLGTGDEAHKRDHADIAARFAGGCFTVKYYEVMDRAGYLQIGTAVGRPHRRLCGCENVGSRPLQHLHVTPRGKCVLCCEDYDEYYVVGDLNEQSVEEVLAGPEIARLRRWVYGIEEAPAGFMCRKCIYARTR
jgi:Radical SAM superfamily/Iron-sulfur cluster-binding domain